MTQFIFYHGAVTIQGIRNLETLLNEAMFDSEDDIVMAICSDGGDVTAGIGLFNYVRMLPRPITTYNFGNCASIAAAMFLAGAKRIASPISRFELHAALYVEGTRKGQISENTALIAQPFADLLSWDQRQIEHYFGSTEEKLLDPPTAQGLGIVTLIEPLTIKSYDKVVFVNIP